MKKAIKFILAMIPYALFGFSIALNIHLLQNKQTQPVEMPKVDIRGFNYIPNGSKGQIQGEKTIQEF